MKDFLSGEPIPPLVAADAFVEMKKTAMNVHPMDAAIGALLGGAYTTHQASQKHKQLPSGDTPFSKKLRKDLELHLEMRQERNGDKEPSFLDKVKERNIRTQLRYANVAQNNPHAAMALEGLAGAAAGALVGAGVGDAAREVFKKADAMGLSRDALEDKASWLGVPIEKIAEFELYALHLSKKAELSEAEEAFLDSMKVMQNRATGKPPEPIKRASISPAVLKALKKEASLGELLVQREFAKAQEREEPPFELVEQAASEQEPADYRAPVREERRRELLGIFGGSTPKD